MVQVVSRTHEVKNIITIHEVKPSSAELVDAFLDGQHPEDVNITVSKEGEMITLKGFVKKEALLPFWILKLTSVTIPFYRDILLNLLPEELQELVDNGSEVMYAINDQNEFVIAVFEYKDDETNEIE